MNDPLARLSGTHGTGARNYLFSLNPKSGMTGGGHGFDGVTGGLQDPANAEWFAYVLDFLQRHGQ